MKIFFKRVREVQTWNDFSYEEIERAITDGNLNELINCQSRYAKVIKEKLASTWAAAMVEAAKKSTGGKIIFSDSDEFVQTWIKRHGAELITRLSNESKKAITNILLMWQEQMMNPRRMAQQIRPLIGLNARQAEANANYRERL